MAFTPANPSSLFAFLLIVIFVLAAILWMIHRAYGAVREVWVAASLLALWLGLQAAVTATGRLTTLPMNGLPLFFGSIVVIWTSVAFSGVGTRIAMAVPMAALVGFQGFRLPLELVLHSWASQGTIPETMTWTGQNWDILSGVVACVVAPFASRSRALVWGANLVGSVLLLNVMRVALLSAPVPFGWHVTPPLLVALHLPYALIGPVCVGGALFGHLVLTRALIARGGASRDSSRR